MTEEEDDTTLAAVDRGILDAESREGRYSGRSSPACPPMAFKIV